MFFPTTQLIFLLTFHKLFSVKLPTLAKRDFKNPSESKRLASESNSLAFYYLRQSKETLKTHRKANDSHRKAIDWRFTTYARQKRLLKPIGKQTTCIGKQFICVLLPTTVKRDFKNYFLQYLPTILFFI